MATPFVRPYNTTTDFENGLHVFYTTIDAGLDYEPTRTIGSYLWYRAYVALTPTTCVVLDDGTGRVVGYCIGASDTASFAQRWRDDFATTIDPQVIPRPNVLTDDPAMERQDVKGFRGAAYEAHCSMLLSWPDVLKKYPAHMHIDILPEYQRKGFGTALINTLFDNVRSEGATGIHLDMVKQNLKARAFYERIGFSVADVVLDGGKSGEKGVNGIVLTLTKNLGEQTV